MANDEFPLSKRAKRFRSLGVEILGESGDDHYYGFCRFCYDEDHFFVNHRTGMWDCKKCEESGGPTTFLERVAEQVARHTPDWGLRQLARDRGIPWKFLRSYGIGYDKLTEHYFIPVRGPSGYVWDIRRYRISAGRIKGTAGCGTCLWNLDELANAERGSIVWLAEGEWDGLALRWALNRAGFRKQCVVASPGAGTFKKHWPKHFRGMRVRIVYDNDDSGRKGAEKAAAALGAEAAEVSVLQWPQDKPDGYDIRDFVKEQLK